MIASVAAVSLSPRHGFSKPNALSIRLLAGFGVEGDAHCGAKVKHRSRAAKTPDAPNLRQVHLIHEELFAELAGRGFHVAAGDLGENIATRNLDVLALPQHARLHIGESAIVEITGLRNPCSQIDRFQMGLMQAVLDCDENGALVRKSGVMGIVIAGGDVRAGDAIVIELPEGEQKMLRPV